MNVHAEVLMAAGYTAFLLLISLSLDFMARKSHIRSKSYRTSGFSYHHAHDAWICPEDQLLTRTETDHERRLIRYRARPQICNHCPTKTDCTDSDEGREVVRAMDPWPHSEAGRFHRGISLVIALMPIPILAAEAFRNHAPPELAVLATALSASALVCWHLHAAFRATPANFPVPRATSPQIPARPSTYRKGEEAQR